SVGMRYGLVAFSLSCRSRRSRKRNGDNPASYQDTITRHFTTALSRLLNALQAGNFQSTLFGAVLVTLLLASQAHSVNEVNGLLIPLTLCRYL
ncbi:MAG TPA: hypothetical protein VFN23_03125, partial [Ktedonobacteraceae bacterium]|nr:hypothetical protein [Ktedonobacteraceae bacterium]